jgi:hypothetical protein
MSPDKTCDHCGGLIPRGSNYRTKRYCGRACYKASYPLQAPARFWAKVDKSAGPDGCWLYMGFRKWDGYGWLARWQDGKARYITAHRYAWELQNGPTNGLHVMHKCDNPPCCNPAHLQLGTHQQNMADMAAKGRKTHGERTRRNKITYELACEIRARFKFYAPRKTNAQELAAEYGLTDSLIYNVGTGRTWKVNAPSPVLHPNRVRPVRRES